MAGIASSFSKTDPLFVMTGKKKETIKVYKEKSFDYKRISFPRR